MPSSAAVTVAAVTLPYCPVVEDFREAAAPHLRGRRQVRVVLGVLPVTVALHPVERAGHVQAVARLPVRRDRRPAVAERDVAVADVVVLLVECAIARAVHERHAEILHRMLEALRIRRRHVQVGAHVVAQRAGDRQVARIAAVDPVRRAVAADVEAVRQLVVDRAAAAERNPRRALGAAADLQLVPDRAARRLLRHDVDDPADRAFAVDHRRRAAQHVDMVDRPRVERKRDADRAVRAHAVIELRDRRRADEAARADSEPPLPGCGDALMPAARLTASTIALSPRVSSVLRSICSTLAGVSSEVRPRRLPVSSGCVSGVAFWALTRIGASVAPALAASLSWAWPVGEKAARTAAGSINLNFMFRDPLNLFNAVFLVRPGIRTRTACRRTRCALRPDRRSRCSRCAHRRPC